MRAVAPGQAAVFYRGDEVLGGGWIEEALRVSEASAYAPSSEIASRLGHASRIPTLLEIALTHPSAAYERDRSGGNERLEFLGDAVLDLAVARLLFDRAPASWREGRADARPRGDREHALALAPRAAPRARRVDAARAHRAALGGRATRSACSRTCSRRSWRRFISTAACDPALAFVERVFGGEIGSGALLERDPKTRFQEWAHAQLHETPRYRMVRDSGIEEAEDRFAIAVEVDGQCWGEGVGRSKRIAELAAADVALSRAKEHDEQH